MGFLFGPRAKTASTVPSAKVLREKDEFQDLRVRTSGLLSVRVTNLTETPIYRCAAGSHGLACKRAPGPAAKTNEAPRWTSRLRRIRLAPAQVESELPRVDQPLRGGVTGPAGDVGRETHFGPLGMERGAVLKSIEAREVCLDEAVDALGATRRLVLWIEHGEHSGARQRGNLSSGLENVRIGLAANHCLAKHGGVEAGRRDGKHVNTGALGNVRHDSEVG